ncbi:hypothetical protein AKJ44_01125 [candidate division MSBL1 archaeon SCGC-AAA261F17]|uniref:Uncharacterized protein n=1 Tax=candidate division MSBL1 archaeon SCGC-AAA261F17 TaxID=1698274 RepID=A0A133V722_9EURY|nr:hypothetical protein AKJ44_01125 [candidate division MSBL1 archaeon SCGC-AAA261F17]
MLKGERGITVGTAALIIAIVAAAIGGGLYLVTHFQKGTRPSGGEARWGEVKDEFIQRLKPENAEVYPLGHLDVRADTVEVLSAELVAPESSECSGFISSENMPEKVWIVKVSALARKTFPHNYPWEKRIITFIVNANTGFSYGFHSSPQIKALRFGPLVFNLAWTPLGTGPRYGLVKGKVSVKNVGDSPLHISGMNVTISGEKVGGVPHEPGPGAPENSRVVVVPPGGRKTITMHFEDYLGTGFGYRVKSFKPGTYTAEFELLEKENERSEVIASDSREITIGKEVKSPVEGLNLKLFRKGKDYLNVDETVEFLAVLENTGSLSKHVSWGSPPSIRVYDRTGRLVGGYPSVTAPVLVTPIGPIGRYLYSFSLEFVRGGKYRVEVSYGIHGEDIDELGSMEDSAWIAVQGPTPSLKEIENLLPDYPVEIKREDGRTTVIVGSPPKTAVGKKEVKQWMHSFDRWLENTRWTDSLSDYGVYSGAPEEEKGYYEVGMNPLSPKLIAGVFRELREASLSAGVGAFGESIPIAFAGNPEAPAIFRRISENMIKTERWVEAIENHINSLYPPRDVGYKITFWSENLVKSYIYLEGEDDRVPFEDIKLELENSHWNLYPGSWDTTVRSPSENLEITGYSVDKARVGSSEWSEMQEVLVRVAPTVRNWSDYPAFVSSVHIRIENSTHTFTRSYPAGVIPIGLISLGIIPSGRTVRIGYQGGPALIPKWSSGGSKSLLRMDELAGKNFRVTLTLKDGEGTTLAKRTFHITFEDLSEKQRNVKLEPSLADLDLSGSTQVNFSREQFFPRETTVKTRKIETRNRELAQWVSLLGAIIRSSHILPGARILLLDAHRVLSQSTYSSSIFWCTR